MYFREREDCRIIPRIPRDKVQSHSKSQPFGKIVSIGGMPRDFLWFADQKCLPLGPPVIAIETLSFGDLDFVLDLAPSSDFPFRDQSITPTNRRQPTAKITG